MPLRDRTRQWFKGNETQTNKTKSALKKVIGVNINMKNAVFWDVGLCRSQKTAFFIVTAVKTSKVECRKI
jgi:hypothetical protein